MLTKKKSKKTIPNKVDKKPIKHEYMDVKEVAELLKMSVSHVYTLTSNKKIPHIKVLGKKVLFEKGELTKWLKSKSVSAE
jgi:hypothetical protein